MSSATFIGRRPELERLQGALDAAREGQPSLVVVVGEAGVGKSRLLAEFAARAEAGGARTLTGGCVDVGEGGLPFAPFAEALKTLATTLELQSETALADGFGASAPLLAELVPELRRVAADAVPVPLADPATRRARLFDAVLDVLGHLAATSPQLLILEDLHWADGSTRDLLRFLLRNLRAERLLLVATVRSDDLHRRHPLMPLLSELERSERVERLELRPFGRDEIVEQLTAILDHHPEASLVDEVAERSDGLPFYVEELAAEDPAGGAVPGSLHGILGQRLAVLPEAALALVRAASVIRRRFSLDELAAATRLEEALLLPALRHAIEAHVLVATEDPAGPTYGFRHELLREAAYEELLPPERIAIHARMADAIEDALAGAADDEPALAADLALHTYHAGDQPRALGAAVRAARALADTAAFREALGHAERALELWPRVADAETRAGIGHGELLALAGRTAANAGRTDGALAHTQAALAELEPSASTERLAELLFETAAVADEAEAWDLSADLYDRLRGLLDELEPSRLQVLALTVVAQHLAGTGHAPEGLSLLDRAMATGRALHDDRAWAIAAFETADQLAWAGRAGRAAALVDAALEVWAPGAPIEGLSASYLACTALMLAGRFEQCARLAADEGRAADRYGLQRRGAASYQFVEAWAMLELGRLEDAERLARSAGESHSWAIDDFVVLKVLVPVHVVRGHLDAARRALLATGPLYNPLWKIATEAVLERAAGNFDRLRAVVGEARAQAERSSLPLEALTWLLLGTAVGAAADHSVAARQRRRAADAEEAGQLGGEWLTALREIVEAGRADGGAGAWAEATLVTAEAEMARVNGIPDATAWRDAVTAWRSLSHPYGTASAQLRLAEALLETSGDRAEVTELLRTAHATATGMGAEPLARAIGTVAALARIGLGAGSENASIEPAQSPLTNRERDVLRLVAAGHTNREIGTALFISEKTVSVHVSNAMRKLEALSRYEVAAAAQQRGYLD